MTKVDAQQALIAAVISALARFSEATGPAAEFVDEVHVNAPRPADEHALGKRQLQIVELPDLATDEGMKTAEVASAIGYELSNTYSALQALARNQVVEQVPGKEPQQWRLVGRYRRTGRAFNDVAALIQPGEWTTAGDVSIAVRGDARAAGSIAGARISHRVLSDDRPPVESFEDLINEGVSVFEGAPDPRQRVSWDELRRRAAVAKERRNKMARGTLNYIQIPASDLDASASFYQDVFGWGINRYPSVGPSQDQPQTAYVGFIDSSGQLGGEFVLGRQASREPGLLPSILVESIDETLSSVVDHGGEVVKARTPIVEGKDWQAIFRDPAGNAMALFESAAS